jgi:integrase/recombinase XerD
VPELPPRYKSVEDCRNAIRQYIGQLETGTDDDDPDLRDQGSTRRYKQDLRWYDHWLDEIEVESPADVTPGQANATGQALAAKFNGTTDLYRWDRIHAFHDWLVRMDLSESNPFERWNNEKDEIFGFSKSSEQSSQLEEEETYALSQDEIRQMEENVGRNRIRDQLIIRLLWQTGMRRGEASDLLISDIDQETREITVREPVAKNDKKRVVAYQHSLDGLLTEWLEHGYRDEKAATTNHERLLVGEKGAPLSGDRINEIAIQAADKAGINRKIYADANAPTDDNGDKIPNRWLVTAHSIRHGFGTHMVNETDAGLWEVSKLMGHSSIKVTEETYVEDDPRAGLDHLHQYGPD